MIGAQCFLTGLVRNPELNGTSVTVVSKRDDGRVIVRLHGTTTSVAVFPKQLRIASTEHTEQPPESVAIMTALRDLKLEIKK